MIPREEEKYLRQINKVMEKADEIYQKFTPETQQKILNYHNSEASLPFCIRWGVQASEELVKAVEKQEKWN